MAETRIEYGYRFDCANELGHEDHAEWEDQSEIRKLNDWERQGGSFQPRGRINNHPVVLVMRTVTYTDWKDAPT